MDDSVPPPLSVPSSVPSSVAGASGTQTQVQVLGIDDLIGTIKAVVRQWPSFVPNGRQRQLAAREISAHSRHSDEVIGGSSSVIPTAIQYWGLRIFHAVILAN